MNKAYAIFAILICCIGVAVAQTTGNGGNPNGASGNGSAVNGITGNGSTGAYLRGICVNNTLYTTVDDDEFTQDSYLSFTDGYINASPAPAVRWSSQYTFGRQNNAGTDDAYYSGPSVGPANYNPFTIGGNTPLQITAEPVPSPYTSSNYGGDSWLSGMLEGKPRTYGYIEVSAKIPNLQGFWPAPIWLLGAGSYLGNSQPYVPPGVQEIDGIELFGNSLGLSNIQQTLIYGYGSPTFPTPTPNPTPAEALHVRTIVSPDPGANFHTYGILWTPTTVTFYIDRVPTSPAYPATQEGPMNPIIILQVFSQSTYAPPPASLTPQSEYVSYYRWYQSTGSGCGGVALSLPTTKPVTTPNPTPSAAATSVTLAQTPVPMAVATGYGQSNVTYTTAPVSGHLLLAIFNDNFTSAPTGWARLNGTPDQLAIYWGVVGSSIAGNGTLSSSTSYNFTGNGTLQQAFDFAGAYTSGPPLISAANQQTNVTPANSLYLLNSGTYVLDAYATDTNSTTGGVTAITPTLPTGQTESLLGSLYNTTVSGSGVDAMRIDHITTEAYQGGAPFSVSASLTTTFTFLYQGADIISILPSGATPGPTPIPYPSPSYPAQAAPWL